MKDQNIEQDKNLESQNINGEVLKDFKYLKKLSNRFESKNIKS